MMRNLFASIAQLVQRLLPYRIVHKSLVDNLENKIYELEYVINSVPQCFLMDKTFRYLGYNAKQKEAMRMIDVSTLQDGIKPDQDLVGLNINEIFVDEVARFLHQNDRDVLQSGVEKKFEEVLFFEDGPTHYMSIKTPMLDRNNQINGMVGVAIDVSHEKHIERQLKNALQVTKDSMRAKDAFIDT